LRALLNADFDAVDSNGDGQVSYSEALIALPGVPADAFNEIDVNGDGQISRAEAGVATDGGCAGCGAGKRALSLVKIKGSLGDIFLAGLSLVVLSLMAGRRSS
jgi:hypothetical protein